jgi:hypothetical protein
MNTLRILFLFILPGLYSCSNYKNSTYSAFSVDNNVCKKLSGHVVLYAVFVDSKYTHPWSAYDINSTLDSIRKASAWIEKNAAANKIPLEIQIAYHQNKQIIPIVNNFPDRSLSASLYTPTIQMGVAKVDRWADRVARIAGQSIPRDTSKIIKTINQSTDRERLIARLRDLYKTDNIALVYFINNYYKEEISVAIHSSSNKEIEYAIVSFKSPAVIAHEFLHLFGAWDLYTSPFLKKRKTYIKKEQAEKLFPDEIMAFSYRNIDSLIISPLTKYLIGWDNELDEKYQSMFGKKIKMVKY